MGDIPLSELTSEMVGEFLEERKRFGNHRRSGFGLGEETMRHIHRLLQQCLDQAIRDGLLTENPAKAFRYRKSTTVKANIMTPLEMEDYLDVAERLGYLPMFMLALTAGLRQGELIALKWSDLDMKKRTLTIAEKRAVERRELVEYGSQTRSIRLTPEVVDLLIMEHSKHPSSPLMFMHPATLKPYSPQMVRRMHNEIIKEAGIDQIFVQDNQSSSPKGVLRGLHFQKQYPQGKLVRVVRGNVFDVAVDLRKGSATYGKWFGMELSAENKKQFAFLANGAEVFVEIYPREFSIEETQENFRKAYETLLNRMTGENESLVQVYSNLNLITYLEEYAMKITWMSSNPQIIDTFGTVYNEDFLAGQKETIILTAVFSYMDAECRYEITVEVVEPVLTKEERFVRTLRQIIRENDESTRTDETVAFPEEIDGEKILYEEEQENHTLMLLFLGIITAVIVFPGMDKELDSRMKERKRQMLLDYSEIVSKLNILSGAGMSILKAWERIVKDYEKKTVRESKARRFAYEEMKMTYYEIQSGISEGSAYAAFGRRCNIHEYLKLGTLLEQNVKKGSKGLSKMLEDEVVDAFEQRKNIAKKLGEEAGTKLMIPMMIMLAIVMFIVLVPAFTSFNV